MLPAAAMLARTSPPGGAVAAELAGAGTTPPFGPGAGAAFSRPTVASRLAAHLHHVPLKSLVGAGR